jgi:hypothetical protein
MPKKCGPGKPKKGRKKGKAKVPVCAKPSKKGKIKNPRNRKGPKTISEAKKRKQIIKKEKRTGGSSTTEKKKTPVKVIRASFGSASPTRRSQGSSGTEKAAARKTSATQKRNNPSQIKGANAVNISQRGTAKAKAQPNRSTRTKGSGLNTRVAPVKTPARKQKR